METNVTNVAHSKGRYILVAFLSIACVFMLSVLFDSKNTGRLNSAQATSTATTTVTVLNTPPSWDITAREQVASATTSPTNVGDEVIWEAQVSDSNGEDWYLLICKSSSTPVGGALGVQPSCGGGGTDQWAVSDAITSGTIGTTSTTTQNSWATDNPWYGYACDSNPGGGSCNPIQYNGLHEPGPAGATSSPFVVNHRPTFTLAADDSPTLPGATTTWTTTSSDTDGDDVQLHVCKAADFINATSECGPGGFWASSTLGASNVSAEGYISVPTQDGDIGAYVYLIDEFGLQSADAWQGSSTVLTIQNAVPYVSSTTIAVYDVFGTTTSDVDLALTVPEGETDNFVMRFSVVDDNSCENTLGGDEITGVDINVFRSGKGGPLGLGCDATGEYDANDCYTHTNSYFNPTCYQVPGDCSGPSQASVEWECLFSMWYIADPTDVGSVYAGEDWRGAARATDDDAQTSTYSVDDEGADGASQMTQFLSFRATGSPIAYGSLEPGQNNPTHLASTTVFATGNTGIDHYLSGDAMCVTFPTCSGLATSTIYVPYQHYSLTEGTGYGAGTLLSTSSAPVLVDVAIGKPTATTSLESDTTYWAIAVPSSITFAGDYLGRNYIDAAIAPSGDW